MTRRHILETRYRARTPVLFDVNYKKAGCIKNSVLHVDMTIENYLVGNREAWSQSLSVNGEGHNTEADQEYSEQKILAVHFSNSF
jgi:hypothetical protein